MEASRSVPEGQPSGWAVFAGFVLLVVGSLDALWGLAAILEDKNVIVGGNGVIISVNAIAQIVWFPAAPLWAFLIIILDVLIIYGLTAGWEET